MRNGLQRQISLFWMFASLPLPRKLLGTTARRIVSCEKIGPSQRIDVVFCSDRTIKRLNAKYRKRNRPTDVLAFPFDDADLLGEVYISLERAAIQARRFSVTYPQEVQRLFVHGILHLLGFDHHVHAQRAAMEARENKYCGR